MKNKKFLFILLLVICTIITGCKTKSKTEQIIGDMAKIEIKADEEQVKKTQDAIERVQRQLKGN